MDNSVSATEKENETNRESRKYPLALDLLKTVKRLRGRVSFGKVSEEEEMQDEGINIWKN